MFILILSNKSLPYKLVFYYVLFNLINKLISFGQISRTVAETYLKRFDPNIIVDVNFLQLALRSCLLLSDENKMLRYCEQY